MHNDKLGLGNDFKNPKTVEHSFLIGSTDMDFAVIWKDYLENKAAPMVFFNSSDKLTEMFNESVKSYENWSFDNEYSLIEENICGYVSSLSYKNHEVFARILNICNKTIDFDLKSWNFIEETGVFGGKKEETRSFDGYGIIEFEINKNSGKKFLQYPDNKESVMIEPFGLSTYRFKQLTDGEKYSFSLKYLNFAIENYSETEIQVFIGFSIILWGILVWIIIRIYKHKLH